MFIENGKMKITKSLEARVVPLLPENLQVIAVAMFECYYLKTLSEASRIS
jgi:hypothetical protein